MMKATDLIGDFAITGSNQNKGDISYEGILSLDVDKNNRIRASWLIQNEQQQFGTGFFKNNILVINFEYLGEDSELYRGVVVYQCLTKDILDGFWSEEYGDPQFLGIERCFRIKNDPLEIN